MASLSPRLSPRSFHACEVNFHARSGKPIARLVPVEPKPRRVLRQDEGLLEVPDDFDAPLPKDGENPSRYALLALDAGRAWVADRDAKVTGVGGRLPEW